MNTTTASSATQLETLVSDLELYERFGDQMSRSELVDAVKTSSAALDSLLAETADPAIRALASVASEELQRFFAFPERYTDGLIVAALMVTRSAIRRIIRTQGASTPRVGAAATHRAGRLGPREVIEVSEDEAHIRFLIGPDQRGTLWHRAEDYKFS